LKKNTGTIYYGDKKILNTIYSPKHYCARNAFPQRLWSQEEKSFTS